MKIVDKNIISSCYEITMDKFIDCLVDGRIEVLGKGIEIDLQEAWANILSEFSTLRNNKTGDDCLELQKEISVLHKKIELINLCVSVLWEIYNRDLANELKMMGYNIKLDWSDKAGYYKDLNLVISKSKTFAVLAERKQKELNALIEKTKGNSYTRKDFISINTNLSKYMQFHINNKEVSVAEWCDMVNKYEAYIEVQHAQMHNQLNKNSRGI